MKLSSFSINNNRDINSSQLKRIRENTTVRQEEEEAQNIDLYSNQMSKNIYRTRIKHRYLNGFNT